MEFNDRRPSIPDEGRVTKGFAAKWYGGDSYSHPDESHLEHFPSMGAAKAELQSRRAGSGTVQSLVSDHTGAVAFGPSSSADTPVVGSNSYMDLHPIRSDGTYDQDVFHRLQFGARGGITRSSS
jgi:hypothetical protein